MAKTTKQNKKGKKKQPDFEIEKPDPSIVNDKRGQLKSYKLTDAEFWNILAENGGLFTITAKAIQEKYKITYTRQSVEERAKRNPERLREIEEMMLDEGENSLRGLMKVKSHKIKLDATKFYLDRKGKRRGYGSKDVNLNLKVTKKPSWMQDDDAETENNKDEQEG